MNKPYSSGNFFLTDSRHKRLENTIDPLLFYREHFLGFLDSENLGTPHLFRLKRKGQNAKKKQYKSHTIEAFPRHISML